MGAIKKGTKLTDTPKDYMLRVRLDEQTLNKLDVICKTDSTSRSEVVRRGIERQFAETKK